MRTSGSDQPIRELRTLLRDGRVTARELADEALARASVGRGGAYRELRIEAARSEAGAVDTLLAMGRDPGPLAGIPISVKDLFGLPGTRTHAGAKVALPPRFETAGPVVQKLLDQLAVVPGKTHTVEFAFGGIGTNAHWGTPPNPRAASGEVRAPGGSSSGAGVSLCEGSAKLAIGTDTAGSVRIPAAWTGNVGVKTTKGRWSTAGIVPLSTTLDTPGVLAATVSDAAFGFAALDGDAGSFDARLGALGPLERKARLGFAQGVFRDGCSPGVYEAVEAGLSRLEAAGLASVREVELPGVDAAKAIFDLGGPTAIELYHFLSREIPEWLDDMDPAVKDRLRKAADTPAAEYLRRRAEMSAAHEKAVVGFGDLDAIVSPTVAITPPLLTELEDLSVYRTRNLATLRNPGLVSFLGLCAVSLPCGEDAAGLPVGLQLIGRPMDEARLLSLAAAFETPLAG